MESKGRLPSPSRSRETNFLNLVLDFLNFGARGTCHTQTTGDLLTTKMPTLHRSGISSPILRGPLNLYVRGCQADLFKIRRASRSCIGAPCVAWCGAATLCAALGTFSEEQFAVFLLVQKPISVEVALGNVLPQLVDRRFVSPVREGSLHA